METKQRMGYATLGAVGLVLGTAALSWGMTLSGIGGSLGRAETWAEFIFSSIQGVWGPLALLAGVLMATWMVLTGRMSFIGKLLVAAIVLGGGLQTLNTYFGSASAATLDDPPAWEQPQPPTGGVEP